jgi:DNA-binding response OmpR family regulator
MAVDIIRSALEFRRLSETEFATRFAGELAWLTTGFPSQAPDETVRRAIDMFRRHGEAVRTIFRQAARDRADALIDGSLPESCLLRMVINSPATELDDTELISGPRPASNEEESSEGSVALDEIFLALDAVEKHVLIGDIAPLTSPSEYRIISVLLKLFREDREAELDPANYRTLSAAELVAEIGEGGDQNGRKAISRLRRKIDREHLELYGSALGLEAVIETVQGKGYRLNPSIRIVSPSQIWRGTGHGIEA